MDILKKASQMADEMLNSVNEMVNRLNHTTKLYAPEDAKGLTAEISVSIQKDGTGEVMVVLGQSLRNFPARSAKTGFSFHRGQKVRIADVGPNVVYVESCEDEPNGRKAAPEPATETKNLDSPASKNDDKPETKPQSKRSRRKKK